MYRFNALRAFLSVITEDFLITPGFDFRFNALRAFLSVITKSCIRNTHWHHVSMHFVLSYL